MSKRVLVTEPVIPSVIKRLENHFTVDVGERGRFNNEQALIKAIPEYHGLLPMLSNPITSKVIAAGENLEIIANYAVGYNNIDLEAADKHNVAVANTPDVLTDSCAEFTMAILLAVSRRLIEAQEYLLDGQFESWEPMGFLGMELQGQTLGIVGMGRIGTAVARRARAFGMQIQYHNRNRVSTDTEDELDARYVDSVEELAKTSHIISLHCPLTESTRYLIDSDILALMPEEAILLNTSRGPVVDEAALADALHNGAIGSAALDVFEEEPKVHPKLRDAPNCLLTPHMASASHSTREAIGMLAADAIIGILNGKTPSKIPNLIQP